MFAEVHISSPRDQFLKDMNWKQLANPGLKGLERAYNEKDIMYMEKKRQVRFDKQTRE